MLLPGYLDSPDYLHLRLFQERLEQLGYRVERLDACRLWETGDDNKYTITNFLKQIREIIESYQNSEPEEVILIGHSMGDFTSIIAGSRISAVTKIVALCPPPDRYGSEKEWQGTGWRHSERDLPDDPTKFRSFDVPYKFAKDGLQYFARDEVKSITKPLMIFIGLKDKVVAPELTEQIVTNANNPYVVRNPDLGHDFRHSEAESKLVMAEIEKFLLG